MHSSHAAKFGAAVLLSLAAVANGQTVTLDFNVSRPFTGRAYFEDGFEMRSLHPSTSRHVHVGDGFIITIGVAQNHSGCCSTPYRFRQNYPTANGPFTLQSLDVVAHSGSSRFVSSSGAVRTVAGTGTISFVGDPGWQNITFFDWDQLSGATQIDNVVLSLAPPNQRPTCTGNPGPFMVNVGDAFSTFVTGTDPDGDFLTLGVSGLPPGASVSPTSGFSPLTAQLSWTPSIGDLGQHDIFFVFRDPRGEKAICRVTIAVVDIPPECDPEDATLMANIGDAVSHTVTGTDPDPGDTLAVSTQGVPAGATVSPTSGPSPLETSFDWTPTVNDVGQHDVTVRFTDAGGEVVECSFVVFVLNRAPTCSPDGEVFTLNIGEPLAFTIAGADADPGDALSVTHGPLPGGATVSVVGSGTTVDADFAWTPSVGDVGLHEIDVTFTDLNGGTATCSFGVEVINLPPECTEELGDPVTSEAGEIIITAGDTFTATLTGTDPDPGDVLEMTSSGLPAGASLTPATATGSSPLSTVFEWTPIDGDVAGNPHLITVAYTDLNLAENTCVLELIVNRPPAAVCFAEPTVGEGPSGLDITVECDAPDGREVTLDGLGSSDPDGDPLTFHWDVSDLSVVLDDPDAPVTSGIFPVGVTMATLTVADGRGGVAICDIIVRVQDTAPPEVECTTNTAALWPPKHDMREIALIVTATDECQDPDFIFPLTVTVRSDEPDNANGVGDGNTTGDVNGQDGFSTAADVTGSLAWNEAAQRYEGTIQLRAERDGAADGRCYTIDVTALDSHGNEASTSCCVVVPHDRRGGNGNS